MPDIMASESVEGLGHLTATSTNLNSAPLSLSNGQAQSDYRPHRGHAARRQRSIYSSHPSLQQAATYPQQSTAYLQLSPSSRLRYAAATISHSPHPADASSGNTITSSSDDLHYNVLPPAAVSNPYAVPQFTLNRNLNRPLSRPYSNAQQISAAAQVPGYIRDPGTYGNHPSHYQVLDPPNDLGTSGLSQVEATHTLDPQAPFSYLRAHSSVASGVAWHYQADSVLGQHVDGYSRPSPYDQGTYTGGAASGPDDSQRNFGPSTTTEPYQTDASQDGRDSIDSQSRPGQTASDDVDTGFQNIAEAMSYLDEVLWKPATGDKDATIPSSDNQKRGWVVKIIKSILDMSDFRDNSSSNGVKRLQKQHWPPKLIAAMAWNLLVRDLNNSMLPN